MQPTSNAHEPKLSVNPESHENYATQSEIPDYVIRFYGDDSAEHEQPSVFKLSYDILMILLLVMDLLLLAVDGILMSDFMAQIGQWLHTSSSLITYQTHYHLPIATIGGFFTLFWVVDLLVRWLIAIIKRTYYRWFFFPFVHWYEVLGCFPALRVLRLLRLVVIIRRLHALNIKIIPERWLKSAQFYYHVLLEELSDRVLLTAIDNFRTQLRHKNTQDNLIRQRLVKSRPEIERAVLGVLRNELTPRLQAALLAEQGQKLSIDVGLAVEKAISQTPELRKYLKLIPIAGSMIESQITHVAKHIGENVTTAINAHLFNDATLDHLMTAVAHGIANVDTASPEIQSLFDEIVEDVLTAFEKQIKIQQWKHAQQLP